jgi:hypothetical protein
MSRVDDGGEDGSFFGRFGDKNLFENLDCPASRPPETFLLTTFGPPTFCPRTNPSSVSVSIDLTSVDGLRSAKVWNHFEIGLHSVKEKLLSSMSRAIVKKLCLQFVSWTLQFSKQF